MNCNCTVGIPKEIPYVFAVTNGSLFNIRGTDALRKHVKLCEWKSPASITSTKLRKHIATMCQLLNLEKRKLEDLQVHKDFSRLPEETLQVEKCGKLLMMDSEKISEFAGKKLDDIKVDMNG